MQKYGKVPEQFQKTFEEFQQLSTLRDKRMEKHPQPRKNVTNRERGDAYWSRLGWLYFIF